MTLSLRNVRTYESLDLDLPEGAVAIAAPNGSGKTTLVSAIDAALFGPTDSRTFTDWLSDDRPEANMSITLTFEHEGGVFRARRTYNGKGRGVSKFDLERLVESRTENGHGLTLSEAVSQIWQPLTTESQSSTQDLLEAEIGLNRDTFRASSFIAANTLFCDLQPREQKRILGELLELGRWDDWLERARRDKRTAENGLVEVEALIGRSEQELAERPTLEAERAEALKQESAAKESLNAAVAALATAREALSQARVKAESRAGAEKGVQRAERALAEHQAAITEREQALANLQKRLASKPQLEEMVADLPALQAELESTRLAVQQWERRGELEGDLACAVAEEEQLRAQATVLDERANEVESAAAAPGGAEVCDRCQQPLYADAAKRAAESYREEAKGLEDRADAASERSKVLSAALTEIPVDAPNPVLLERLPKLPTMIQARVTAQMQLAQIEEAESHGAEMRESLDRLRAVVPEREAAVATARALLEDLGPHDPQEQSRRMQELELLQFEEAQQRDYLAIYTATVSKKDAQLERLDKIAADVSESHVRRDALHADLDLYTRMEKACGPNGVPALILEQIAIPRLEASADEILRRFGSKALGVQLLTQREKKSGGLADTLQVNVLTEHGSRDYRTFSTGERLRVNAAITLAIAQFVAGRSARTGLLVIDDLGPLDAQGMAVLADICRDLQESVGSVFVISQSSELRDAFEQSLTIAVDADGHSHVVSEMGAGRTEQAGLASQGRLSGPTQTSAGSGLGDYVPEPGLPVTSNERS